MAKKITEEQFLKRFKTIFPESKIKILEYTAISKPCIIQCLKCKKIHHYNKGNDVLNRHFCCETHQTKLDSIIERLKNNDEYSFIKKVNKDNIIIRHNVCGQEMQRAIVSAFKEPCSCSYCQSVKFKNMLSKEDAQKKIDETFFNTIQMLEYNGYDNKGKFKCLKCGMIFTQRYNCLLQSRGCPQCDRWKSKGETKIMELLKENNIIFQEQVQIAELPLQHFDFAVYDTNDQIQYFIECQGEQHFEEKEIFSDSLEKIQERDERKRKYCKDHNIPLYEIVYKKGKLLNLNILPFMKNC